MTFCFFRWCAVSSGTGSAGHHALLFVVVSELSPSEITLLDSAESNCHASSRFRGDPSAASCDFVARGAPHGAQSQSHVLQQLCRVV